MEWSRDTGFLLYIVWDLDWAALIINDFVQTTESIFENRNSLFFCVLNKGMACALHVRLLSSGCTWKLCGHIHKLSVLSVYIHNHIDTRWA